MTPTELKRMNVARLEKMIDDATDAVQRQTLGTALEREKARPLDAYFGGAPHAAAAPPSEPPGD